MKHVVILVFTISIRNILYINHVDPVFRLKLLNNNIANKGAPMRAVMTPIGNSRGETIVRATTSANTKNVPPYKKESGNNFRWFAPQMRRVIWGITSPTNPIVPDTATAAPVSKEALSKIASFFVTNVRQYWQRLVHRMKRRLTREYVQINRENR